MNNRKLAESTITASRYIKQLINNKLFRRKFIFHTPSNNKPIILPYSQWKQSSPLIQLDQQQRQRWIHFELIAIFIISFGLADFIATTKYNQTISYRYYIQYPIPMRILDQTLITINQYIQPILQFLPQNKYHLQSFIPNIFKHMTKQKQKIAQHDRKAIQLKTQIQQLDNKYPIL